MNKIYKIFLSLGVILLLGCQDDNASLNGGTGYLRLTVSESEDVNTRAYNPEQIQVIIREKESKKEVKSTDDWTNWEGESIELSAGEYTIIAKSYEYDNERGFDKPYYYGSQDVTIEAGKENNATVTCKLANVKVTVQYDAALLKALEGHTYSVEVGSSEAGSNIAPLVFANDEKRAAYFPVSELYAKINIDGAEDKTLTQNLAGVKARDHYMLRYKLTDKGSSNVTVAIDPTHNEYAYTFEIDMTPISVTADFEPANAWATFAYLKASNVESTSTTVDPAHVSFQYRKKGATDWIKIETTQDDNGVYTAHLTGLESATEYEYCLAVGEENTSAEAFTTEEAKPLENGDFDDWFMDGSTWYAIHEDNATSRDESKYLISFWDSGNLGASIMGANPTSPEETIVRNGKSAKLASQTVSIAFAAGSLYTGHYVETILEFGIPMKTGARLNFGQPFTSRPIALKGYFQYAPKNITAVGANQPSGTVEKGDPDMCSIYIALTNKTFEINNTDPNKLFNKDAEGVIAYGELPEDLCISTDKKWQDFEIPLIYNNLTEKPTHIIVVCSSSKYGDYFTGGEGSTMYLDDFELVYDGNPRTSEIEE